MNNLRKYVGSLSRFPIYVLTMFLLLQGAESQYYSDACKSIEGKLGTCVPLLDCPLFTSWLKTRPLVKQNIKTLIEYTCYLDVRNPKVCCPNDNMYTTTQPPTTKYDPVGVRLGTPVRRGISSGQSTNNKLHFPSHTISFPTPLNNKEDFKPGRQHTPLLFPTESGKIMKPVKNKLKDEMDLKQHQNFRLLPGLKECSNGLKLDSLIGTYGAHPWLALVGIKPGRYTLEFEHVCAGVIINSKYVLSAAHCFNSKGANPKYIRLGEYDLKTLIDEGNEFLPQSRREDFKIEKVTVHPGYNPVENTHDIALIRVDRPINFNTTFIKAACLPFVKEYGIEDRLGANSHWYKEHEGESAWVAGWSRHSWDGRYSTGSESSILQEGFAQFTPFENCQQDYPLLAASFINAKSQLCVGGKGNKNSCVVDSGGPLMYPIKVPSGVPGFVEPKFFLLGLLSHGPTGNVCQNTGEDSDDPDGRSLPSSVYTRVSKYLKWILNNMQE